MTSHTQYSRTNPFPAKMLVNRRLSGEGSAKDTRHFEISLEGSGLTFEPGDSMAVYARNDPELVEEVIRALGATGEEQVPVAKDKTEPFREALSSRYSITSPTPKFLKAIAERASAAPLLKELLDPAKKQDLRVYLWGMEVIDFLLQHPSVKFPPAELVGLLTKLQPRLYSVANSLRVYPNAVHLIVDVIRYESHGRPRKGVASTFLAERCNGEPVPVYPASAKHFHLPENDVDMIMVGPGTGIAPFRAFLQERRAVGAHGRNWLFFGAQRQSCDAYYGEEFEEMKREGLLTRYDCAYSRDQAHKIYVQHRMTENANELWRWLESGAHFYVCGDALRMAKDVDAALRTIVQEQSVKSAEEAQGYVEQMKLDKRYKRDVY
jgi:sulfite reductase (NADPH) flavoprotein alpha-component